MAKKSLTFQMDDEEEVVLPIKSKPSSSAAATSTSSSSSASTPSSLPASDSSSTTVDEPPSKKPKFVSNKDPTADTSFLPDRARDLEEESARIELEREWNSTQEKIKNENIQVVYSYWDGSGHRNKIIVKKGETMGEFLEKVRKAM
jgi:protein FAM50